VEEKVWPSDAHQLLKLLIEAGAIFWRHRDKFNSHALAGRDSADDGAGSHIPILHIEQYVDCASDWGRLRGMDENSSEAQGFQSRDRTPRASFPRDKETLRRFDSRMTSRFPLRRLCHRFSPWPHSG
jgi:hypothetical protein